MANPNPITSLSQLTSIWDAPDDIEWVVPGLIPDGMVTMISGKSGDGKSYLAYWLGARIAQGLPIFGKPVAARPVIYFDRENHRIFLKKRLREMGVDEKPPLFHVWDLQQQEMAPGPDDTRILGWAKEHRALLIWDSYVAFFTGKEENPNDTRQFMDNFRNLATRHGIASLILHHPGKGGTSKIFRGSSDIQGSLDFGYSFKKKNPEKNLLKIATLEPFKTRLPDVFSGGMKLVAGKGWEKTDLEPVQVNVPDTVSPMEVVEKIVRDNPWANQSKVISWCIQAGLKRGNVIKCLDDARFEFKKGGRNGMEKLYHLKEAKSDTPRAA